MTPTERGAVLIEMAREAARKQKADVEGAPDESAPQPDPTPATDAGPRDAFAVAAIKGMAAQERSAAALERLCDIGDRVVAALEGAAQANSPSARLPEGGDVDPDVAEMLRRLESGEDIT